jgi:pimeloyl-ACP methyl ester carboxylesterase
MRAMKGRVLLVGWGNSSPSQLAAYERLYAAMGLEARSVIPVARAGLADPSAYARSLAPVARDLVAEDPDRPLFVHLFSDNGFIGWAALLQALEQSPDGARVKAAIRGVVHDSSPGLWNVRGKRDFARRFSLGMTPALSQILGLGFRERLPVLTPLLAGAFLLYQVAFPRAVKSMLSAADKVTRLQPTCPHLFLYGAKDDLVRPEDVRAWITRQRAAGIEVEDVEFSRAKHVALFISDPRRYRDALKSFVTRLSQGSA